ncbi:hypothetical protein B0T11DRAFT_68803 [Plectosphaerella cucumerina]|uniref:Uncharacterized protein n=1 Tax=Plectosphaerella cucumerina TaxID=40658 RepID=A0A8K0X728_9PEZI|nr:hypothetical protein B0T11DRAFT_68803 [Plectosphaerella cucumerina]
MHTRRLGRGLDSEALGLFSCDRLWRPSPLGFAEGPSFVRGGKRCAGEGATVLCDCRARAQADHGTDCLAAYRGRVGKSGSVSSMRRRGVGQGSARGGRGCDGQIALAILHSAVVRALEAQSPKSRTVVGKAVDPVVAEVFLRRSLGHPWRFMRAADLPRSHLIARATSTAAISSGKEGMEMNPPDPRCTINHIVCRAEQAKGRGGAVAGPRGSSRWSKHGGFGGRTERTSAMHGSGPSGGGGRDS